MVIYNCNILALYSSIDTSTVVSVLTGNQCIESRFNKALQAFDTDIILDTKSLVRKGLPPDQVIKVISKNLPVIHIRSEDDTVTESLTVFKTVRSFKEKWHSGNVWCYFGVSKEHFEYLDALQPFSIRHYSSLLHEFWLDTNDVFHVDFEKNYMHVFCKNDGHFLFYNKMFFENDVDVHYHLALIQQEVLQRSDETEIIFSGEISKDSKIMKSLASYYSKIRFVNDKKSDFIVNDKVIDALYFDKYLGMVCV